MAINIGPLFLCILFLQPARPEPSFDPRRHRSPLFLNLNHPRRIPIYAVPAEALMLSSRRGIPRRPPRARETSYPSPTLKPKRIVSFFFFPLCVYGCLCSRGDGPGSIGLFPYQLRPSFPGPHTIFPLHSPAGNIWARDTGYPSLPLSDLIVTCRP